MRKGKEFGHIEEEQARVVGRLSVQTFFGIREGNAFPPVTYTKESHYILEPGCHRASSCGNL